MSKKKIYISLSAIMIISGLLIASCTKKEQQIQPREVTKNEIGMEAVCPVTKNKFKVVQETIAVDYKEKTYYFCCPGCDSQFIKEPDKFISHHQTKPDESKTVTRKTQVYYCPMHPTYTSDKQGDCPICNMSLVPMETMEHKKETQDKGISGREPVVIPYVKQQLIGVKTGVIKRKNLTKTILTVGRVAYDAELYYAQEEYISSLRRYQQMKEAVISEDKQRVKSLLDSAKFRLKLLGISEDQINELTETDKPDMSLLITESSKSVWVYAEIYEYDLKYIKRGQSVYMTTPYDSSVIFKGKIIAIDPVLNPQTRSVRIRIITDNISSILKPETYMNVQIKIPLGTHKTIPADSVLDSGTRQIVFIDKGEGVFVPKEIVVGEKIDDDYIVKSGIDYGDKVVIGANFLIDSESQLKSAIKQMTGEHKH